MLIRYLVVHCSDSPDGRQDTGQDIHRWHRERGWDGIGYHYVIERDGKVQRGRPEYWQGAHVRGHNHHSLGICLIGREDYTQPQQDSLERLLRSLLFEHDQALVVGHYQLDSHKTCPNFDVPQWARAAGLQTLGDDDV